MTFIVEFCNNLMVLLPTLQYTQKMISYQTSTSFVKSCGYKISSYDGNCLNILWLLSWHIYACFAQYSSFSANFKYFSILPTKNFSYFPVGAFFAPLPPLIRTVFRFSSKRFIIHNSIGSAKVQNVNL